jgi:hypothetical protein
MNPLGFTGSLWPDMVIYGLIIFVCVLLLLRYGMAAAGLWKDSVLRASQRYDVDDTYYVLPGVLLSLGVLIIAASLLIGLLEPRAERSVVIGFLFVVLAYFAFIFRDNAREHPEIFCSLPRWYVDLRAVTTREERRRLAFLWLRLPLRMRMRYNLSHHHFWLWADLVILGTITQTMYDAAVEAEGQWVTNDMEKRLYP